MIWNQCQSHSHHPSNSVYVCKSCRLWFDLFRSLRRGTAAWSAPGRALFVWLHHQCLNRAWVVIRPVAHADVVHPCAPFYLLVKPTPCLRGWIQRLDGSVQAVPIVNGLRITNLHVGPLDCCKIPAYMKCFRAKALNIWNICTSVCNTTALNFKFVSKLNIFSDELKIINTSTHSVTNTIRYCCYTRALLVMITQSITVWSPWHHMHSVRVFKSNVFFFYDKW